jgi:protein SCO1/2
MRRIALVSILVAAGVVGCRERTVGTSAAPSLDSAPLPAPSTPPRSDLSIYVLSMTLTDQNGEKVGLDVFRGKPVFVGMFYGTCPSACPMLISTIKQAMSKLDAATAAEVRVLLVSFDPVRDTPEALRAIVTRRELDPRWKLASAPEDQVRDLAALLGVQYRRLPDGNFSHTSSIVLLNRAGAIDTRLDDTAQPVNSLVVRARAISVTN